MTGLRLPSLSLGLKARADRWLFRLRPDEAAPVVLGQRRIFVLPTAAGLAFAVTLLTLLIASINYNLSLGYAFTFLLAGLGIVTIVHTFRNLADLSIAPTRHVAGFAGEASPVDAEIDSEIANLLDKGLRVKEIAEILGEKFGHAKKDIYRMILQRQK